MRKPIKLFTIALTVLAFGSCNYDKSSEVAPVVKNSVSFKLDIQPIFDRQCVMCHTRMMGVEPDLRPGLAYQSLISREGSIEPGNSDGSELMDMLHGGGDNPMPPGTKISPTEIALIAKWIDEGALNN